MTAVFQTAYTNDVSLTLNKPKEGFVVVQHIPKDSVGRDQNPLYLKPRRINQEEYIIS
jgi:peptide deformylase